MRTVKKRRGDDYGIDDHKAAGADVAAEIARLEEQIEALKSQLSNMQQELNARHHLVGTLIQSTGLWKRDYELAVGQLMVQDAAFARTLLVLSKDNPQFYRLFMTKLNELDAGAAQRTLNTMGALSSEPILGVRPVISEPRDSADCASTCQAAPVTTAPVPSPNLFQPSERLSNKELEALVLDDDGLGFDFGDDDGLTVGL